MIPEKIKRTDDYRRGYQAGFGAGEKRVAGVKPRKLRELLNEILNHQIANRGTDSAYHMYCSSAKDMPEWVAKAERAIQELSK